MSNRGVKRMRTGPQSTNNFATRHAEDRVADREPNYTVGITAPESVVLISSDKRDSGSPYQFTQTISTIPNVGRIRVKKVTVDHLFHNVHANNNQLAISNDYTVPSKTVVLTLDIGIYSLADFASHLQAKIRTYLSTTTADFANATVSPAALMCGASSPTDTQRKRLVITNVDNISPMYFLGCSFFEYGNPMHGLGSRTIPSHLLAPAWVVPTDPEPIQYVSPTGWYPPAVIAQNGGSYSGGIANGVASHYYIIASQNLTQGSKMQSYGATANALGIFYCLSNDQSGTGDYLVQEEQELDNAHSVSASLTRQIGGSVDITIFSEYGHIPTTCVENAIFSMSLVISKHY